MLVEPSLRQDVFATSDSTLSRRMVWLHKAAPRLVIVRIDQLLVGLLIAAGSAACRDLAAPANGPASIAIVSGDGQEAVTATGSQTFTGTGTLPDSLRVRVTNSAGAPVSGVRVTWTTGGGSVSPSVTTTDSAGVAAARWSWYAPQTWYVAPGVYTATALLANVESVTFTGYARVGVALRELQITPDTVSVASGPATVVVSLRATDDRTAFGLSYTSVTLVSPPGTPPAFWFQPLTLVSGTPADGIWRGSITVPQGTPAGDWEIMRVILGWGCGGPNRVELSGTRLSSLELPLRLHVEAATAATGAYTEGRIGPPTSATLRPEVSYAGC
jgi:hypothetical protein